MSKRFLGTRNAWLSTGLALAAIVGAGSARATPCVMAPASTYTASGFSCNVASLTFSDITIAPSTTGDGTVGPITVTPLTDGLALTFSAAATFPPSSTADISWLYTVTSTVPITDAGLSLTGTGLNGATVILSETLSNDMTLTASNPGSPTDSITFPGVSSLSVTKDLSNVALTSGTAVSSIIDNTFSTAVPEPSALILLGTALAGLAWFGLRKRV